MASPNEVCCVADSKGWCGNVLAVAQQERLRVLSRLPRTHALHDELMARAWSNPQVMEVPSKPGKPADRYEFHGYDVEEMLTVSEVPVTAPAGTAPTKRAITVPARAVRVYSTALLRSKLKTIGRITKREARAAVAAIRDWQDCAYACDTDAQ